MHVAEDDFYAVMDAVRESDCRLVTVDSIEPDMEDVFLQVVEEGGR